MIETPPPPGSEQIQREEFARVFRRFLEWRLLIVPFFALVALPLVFLDPSGWRRAVVIGVAMVLLVVSVLELFRFRRDGLGESAVAVNLLAGVVGQSALILATGGIESPLLPVVIPIAMLAGLVASRAAVRTTIVLLQVAVLWAMALAAVGRLVPDLVPEVFGGGARAGHVDAHVITAAAVMTVILLLSVRVGRGLRRVIDGIVRRTIEAREESLRAHAERARELTVLSGEIAHELKNPLASVKGLGGLLARDVPDGKPAERLAVLRREVDRMGEVLEGFLDFSRPLLPLERTPADLGALLAEVAILHEGLARERSVAIDVAPGRVASRSDPRKVKQILLNLLQNALDVAPAGTRIELAAEAVPGGARLEVLDRGPGLAPEVVARVFEPGVTTKAKGSGLGLTIARALARQHGGELRLLPRDGGGLVAEVVLPDAIPGEGEAA